MLLIQQPMDFLDVLFHLESNPVMILKKYSMLSLFKDIFLPKISSTANASNILDAPITPDKHAEKVADIIPMITNGPHILTSCKNK